MSNYPQISESVIDVRTIMPHSIAILPLSQSGRPVKCSVGFESESKLTNVDAEELLLPSVLKSVTRLVLIDVETTHAFR